MSYFEDVYLVSISSIVPVKSDQFNCYLDLIAFPRSGWRKQYMQAWELILVRLWRNFTVASPGPQTVRRK